MALADTGRRVRQTHAGSAVEEAVTAAGGSPPHTRPATALFSLTPGTMCTRLSRGGAVGAAVAVAEGSLPHGSRTSDGSLLADAGRRA